MDRPPLLTSFYDMALIDAVALDFLLLLSDDIFCSTRSHSKRAVHHLHSTPGYFLALQKNIFANKTDLVVDP